LSPVAGYNGVVRRTNYVLERQEIETKWFESFLGNQMVGLFASFRRGGEK
jgi:hypothetical protein